MWKLALAFAAGGAAGWFARFAADAQATTSAPAAAPAAQRAVRDPFGPARRPRARAPVSAEVSAAPFTSDQSKTTTKAPARSDDSYSDAEVLAMLKARGYKFVSLEEAMRDPAYSLPDGYAGPGGFSWIHRWSKAKGMPDKGEPDEPGWLREAYARLQKPQ